MCVRFTKLPKEVIRLKHSVRRAANRVIVCDGEKEIELKMQTDYALDKKVEYKGKIAYLKYSNYLIWYDLDQN